MPKAPPGEGAQVSFPRKREPRKNNWIPAFGGMTHKAPRVIPAQAGTQKIQLDSRFRGSNIQGRESPARAATARERHAGRLRGPFASPLVGKAAAVSFLRKQEPRKNKAC